MKTLCWNTDDAVWKHWNQIVSVSASLVRVKTLTEVHHQLESNASGFRYGFIYLEDISSPKQVEEVVALCAAFPKQKFIVFPNQSSQTAALRLFSAGVSGQCAPYIGKEQLALVLSVVDSGEIWGGKVFIQQLIMQSTVKDPIHNDELEDLSERELKVADFVSKGLSNKQIAQEMDITERTVKAHLTSIFKKTNTKDRLSLALLAQTKHAVL